jgi:hypothetical protein
VIWLTWRQSRAEVIVGSAILVALAAILVGLGLDVHNTVNHLGLPACLTSKNDCSNTIESLRRAYHWVPPATGVLVVLPVFVGMFWAAPLIAREYEAGTQRLAWTQSVSRLRWLTTKLVLILATATAAALGIGLLAEWALEPLGPAYGTLFGGTWFDGEGLVPAAYMLFALAAGAAASALTRRTIPAMAVTLVAYFVPRLFIHYARKELLPPNTHVASAPVSDFYAAALTGQQPAFGGELSPTDWVISTSSGPVNDDVLRTHCPTLNPRNFTPDALHDCLDKLRGLSFSVVTRFQPPSRFWPLQAVETGIFVAMAAFLIAVTIVTVTRSRRV